MGCVTSKRDINDIHPNIFQVLNVDDDGNKLNQGQLEVTEERIVFYAKGKEPIRWPLRCLRRYGYEQELFSFESGRKSDTGPGIYAFRCGRAEQLFNLLQANVRSQREPSATAASVAVATTMAPALLARRDSRGPATIAAETAVAETSLSVVDAASREQAAEAAGSTRVADVARRPPQLRTARNQNVDIDASAGGGVNRTAAAAAAIGQADGGPIYVNVDGPQQQQQQSALPGASHRIGCLNSCGDIGDAAAAHAQSGRSAAAAGVPAFPPPRVPLTGGVANGFASPPTPTDQQCNGVVMNGVVANGVVGGESWRHDYENVSLECSPTAAAAAHAHSAAAAAAHAHSSGKAAMPAAQRQTPLPTLPTLHNAGQMLSSGGGVAFPSAAEPVRPPKPAPLSMPPLPFDAGGGGADDADDGEPGSPPNDVFEEEAAAATTARESPKELHYTEVEFVPPAAAAVAGGAPHQLPTTMTQASATAVIAPTMTAVSMTKSPVAPPGIGVEGSGGVTAAAMGYAIIDIQKTDALKKSVNPAPASSSDAVDEPGSRKTRHNSTLGESPAHAAAAAAAYAAAAAAAANNNKRNSMVLLSE